MPHPDDEAYSSAGTLALAADRGAAVAVLCVTQGELGGDARERGEELRASCDAIGAACLPSLGWPDAGVADVASSSAVTAVMALRDAMQGWWPDVVLGLGADGVYGHSDHLALHGLLRAAILGPPAESSSWSRPALYEAVFPHRHFHPVWRALRRQRFP